MKAVVRGPESLTRSRRAVRWPERPPGSLGERVLVAMGATAAPSKRQNAADRPLQVLLAGFEQQLIAVEPDGLRGLPEWEIRDQTAPLCVGLKLKRQHARVYDHSVDLDEPRERVVGQ
jgi:hypothetical protein